MDLLTRIWLMSCGYDLFFKKEHNIINSSIFIIIDSINIDGWIYFINIIIRMPEMKYLLFLFLLGINSVSFKKIDKNQHKMINWVESKFMD